MTFIDLLIGKFTWAQFWPFATWTLGMVFVGYLIGHGRFSGGKAK